MHPSMHPSMHHPPTPSSPSSLPKAGHLVWPQGRVRVRLQSLHPRAAEGAALRGVQLPAQRLGPLPARVRRLHLRPRTAPQPPSHAAPATQGVARWVVMARRGTCATPGEAALPCASCYPVWGCMGGGRERGASPAPPAPHLTPAQLPDCPTAGLGSRVALRCSACTFVPPIPYPAPRPAGRPRSCCAWSWWPLLPHLEGNVWCVLRMVLQRAGHGGQQGRRPARGGLWGVGGRGGGGGGGGGT